MVFHWSLSDGKFPKASRTFLSILADLSSAVVWIVSAPPPISNSSNLITKPLVTVLIIIIRTPCEFFTPASVDGLSLESD